MHKKLELKEYQRYARHFALPEIGMEGQTKLKNSSVLVIGAGGLGAPILLYLTAAGVGTIGIVDFDKVDITNLQRQILYDINDIGQSKSLKAKEKLLKLNPEIEIKTYELLLSSENALDIIKDYDIIIDGTDNFQTRYLVNDACVLLNKVNIYGSIFRFEGQVSVFNYNDGKEYGPTYRDLYPTPPDPSTVPNCAEGGVLGVLPGIIGSFQANEAIKIITNTGSVLSGKLVLFDSLSMQMRTINISKLKNRYNVEKLIDYNQFCQINTEPMYENVASINSKKLKSKLDKGEKLFLIDVREPWEHEMGNIGGILIPMNSIPEYLSEIPKEKEVIIYCRSGRRSAEVILWLQENQQYSNLKNLEGGILSYIKEIDSTLPLY